MALPYRIRLCLGRVRVLGGGRDAGLWCQEAGYEVGFGPRPAGPFRDLGSRR
ncbi:hypothetical protein [Kribbella sp. NPDC048915]|uniref:hypothetical protein n=1 Tax=Kribbella sp. NPDC048915 TaxID=3155148 RepID=UPI0033D06965